MHAPKAKSDTSISIRKGSLLINVVSVDSLILTYFNS